MNKFTDITDYIPQRHPFVMVDELIFVSDELTISQFKIPDDNLFCENNIFYESGMLENIAQTVAAGAGYKLKQNKEEPSIGFIGAIKKAKIHNRPLTGDTIRTEVHLITALMGALVVEGRIFKNDLLLAVCQMNIFILRNTDDLMFAD